jgi:signal recognition particle receptor subunit beta
VDLRSSVITTLSTISVKIAVVGGPRAGKTAFLDSLSAAPPLAVPGNADATTAMDFVRVRLDEELTLHLVAVNGADLPSLWGQAGSGAVGAVLLADNRRLADARRSAGFLADREVPYVVAVNRFDRRRCARIAEARQALGADDSVPVVACDPRVRATVRQTLVRLIEHTLDSCLVNPARPNRSAFFGRHSALR